MVDQNAVKGFNFLVWTYKMGEQVSLMIHIGERLGFYRGLAGAGPQTPAELAATTGTHERFVREWLLGQAAARLVERHDDGRFELTDVQAEVMANEETSVDFAAGAFSGGTDPVLVDRIVDSFRTGVGLSYEDQGPAAATALARMTAPRSRLTLISQVLPGLEGVVDKLNSSERAAKVIDVGCGGGVSLTTIAEAYPQVSCVGYDPSESAIALARALAAEKGLDNCTFVVGGAEDLPAKADADLVLCFDCLHDMPRPDLAAAAIAKAMRPDGTWLIKDIRSSGEFTTDRSNPLLALLYSLSVMSCLQSALSSPDGLGLGTLGLHPARVSELIAEVGLKSLVTHDFDDAANLYYEVRSM